MLEWKYWEENEIIFEITSGDRWDKSSKAWSFCGPTPRPSRISIVIERDTTSRDLSYNNENNNNDVNVVGYARSLAFGA